MPNIKVRLTTESDTQSSVTSAEASKKAASGDVKKMASASLFAHAAAGNLKQAVKFGLGNVGNFTGNYIQQNNIDVALELAEDASSIALGALAGGWVGAVIATASIGVRAITKEISRQNQMALDKAQYRYDAARAGNNLFDNSRGTED